MYVIPEGDLLGSLLYYNAVGLLAGGTHVHHNQGGFLPGDIFCIITWVLIEGLLYIIDQEIFLLGEYVMSPVQGYEKTMIQCLLLQQGRTVG